MQRTGICKAVYIAILANKQQVRGEERIAVAEACILNANGSSKNYHDQLKDLHQIPTKQRIVQVDATEGLVRSSPSVSSGQVP